MHEEKRAYLCKEQARKVSRIAICRLKINKYKQGISDILWIQERWTLPRLLGMSLEYGEGTK